ncbi:MAG: PBECR2 nuclease fold domain-containing protein [Desulfovibrionaceae bacterium]|nr:PBECR2 nuclease fold domain-containing protein [Desulfovibrionaceae bacterium]
MAEAAYGSLPFQEQLAYFRRKLVLPTASWTDVLGQEHDWAFVVAGANRDAILEDFRQAIDKAIELGTTLEEFRRDFDRIVAEHGWDYHGSRNWRSRVIYETNLSSSYAAGRHEQLQEAPYWQYQHADWVAAPRPEHLAWDGLILERDDPWWNTHYPPNGWGCQCSVRGLWPRDLRNMGKDGPDDAPAVRMIERAIGQNSPNGPRTVQVPEGIDPGWAYAPGAARLRSAIPPERPDPPVPGSAGGQGLPNLQPAQPLPNPRPMPASMLLPTGLAAKTYVAAFLETFGTTLEQPAIAQDPIGERLVIGKELFQDAKGNWKALKRGREQYLPLLAQALSDPDEIWARIEWMYSTQKAVVRRRYIARFEVAGQEEPMLIVFERGDDGWAGVTAFQGVAQSADDWRVGVLVYRRP